MTTPDAGNLLLRPPRRTGSADSDMGALWEWMNDLYRSLALEQNTIGSVEELQAAVEALTARVAAAEAKLRAISEVTVLVGPVAATYTAQQLADAYNKINMIITEAR